MTNDPASLDRLHDLVLPPPVPLWPPAPGWYLVLALVAGSVLWLGYRGWRRWRADAYRRAAVREMAVATDAVAIAELLRRTALVIMPRERVARMVGSAWVDWLAAQSDQPLSAEVRELLTSGMHRRPVAPGEVRALHEYAVRWIAHHRSRGLGVEGTG